MNAGVDEMPVGSEPAAQPSGAPQPRGERRRVNLALQGGGSHGAFTWGVLDRLMEDGRLDVAGISGTSAGAMNAVVLAYGLSKGGPAEARACLTRFWNAVTHRARHSPLRPSWFDKLVSKGDMDYSPGFAFFDTLSRTVSPYAANPNNYNPLAEVLSEVVDFPWLNQNCHLPLYICATNVKTSRLKVFEGHEVTEAAVMASACLPFLFKAVEIDGESYWDGGFMGNPPLYPLIYGTDCEDLLLVQINPVKIPFVPTSAREILDRMNELSFNSALMKELRSIAFVQKLLADNRVTRGRYKDVKLHLVEAETAMTQLGYSSKMNTDAEFLDWLFQLGRERAAFFLQHSFDKIGVASSVDMAERFL